MAEFSFGKVVRLRASNTLRTMLAGLRIFGQSGDEDSDGTEGSGAAEDDVEVVQPAGLMAWPAVKAGLQALWSDLGEQVFALALLNKKAQPQDLEEGETRLYGVGDNADCQVRLRASGAVNVDASAGKDVVVNGGTASVIRAGDGVNAAGTAVPPVGMAGWMTQVTAALNTLSGTTGITVPSPPTQIGTTDGGAAHFKA